MWRSCRPSKILLGILWLTANLSATNAGANGFLELEDTRFPLRQHTESGPFSLQGAGILTWAWFNVYAAAYYVNEAQAASQRLVIHYFVPIEAEQIKSAAEKHLIKQHGAEYLSVIKPALNQLHSAIRDVKEGDRYAITLTPGEELVLERNGKIILRLAESQLGKIYLGLWLGDPPLDEELKARLLGIAEKS